MIFVDSYASAKVRSRAASYCQLLNDGVFSSRFHELPEVVEDHLPPANERGEPDSC